MGMDFRVARRISEAFLGICLNSTAPSVALFFFFSAYCHLKMHPGLKKTRSVFCRFGQGFFCSVGVVLSPLFLFFAVDIFKMQLKIS